MIDLGVISATLPAHSLSRNLQLLTVDLKVLLWFVGVLLDVVLLREATTLDDFKAELRLLLCDCPGHGCLSFMARAGFSWEVLSSLQAALLQALSS